MDAAIAGLFCNGIYTAFSMGLGGGFLMTIYIKETGEVTTLTAREMAPAYVTEDMFDDNPMGAQEGIISTTKISRLRVDQNLIFY